MGRSGWCRGLPSIDLPMDAAARTSTAPAARAATRIPAVVRLVRPRQWSKNVLVLTAPFAAGDVFADKVLLHTALAFTAFCLAASGVYCLNDARDVESDRAHPTKHRRPVAAGEVSVTAAVSLGIVLLAGGLAVAAVVRWQLLLVVGSYVAVQVGYSLRLKDLPVFDIACVASGFVLRAVAGGAAAPVAISQWFLIVAGFGSLFIVAGKRSAEHADLGVDAGTVRATLAEYSVGFLLFVRAVAASVCLAAYCLWAFERPRELGGGEIWYELSIIPFVLGILHYALRLEQGDGAAPEDIILRDRTLQLVGLVWVVVFGLGVRGS
ncbi:MAG: decaprenyl-phosphate phosphoribosyltransferase [Actinomycetota bacterium]|nr:decaprenyl-phosphate phosphoribosyltransferase [Actinomycetota bacterium]